MPPDDIPASEGTAPASAPASLTAEQIADVVTKSIDARIPALQSGYDKRINDLETQLRQSDMDEDEVAEEKNAKLQQELASAKIEADIQKAARLYPDAYPVFDAIRSAGTAEEQLKIIKDRLASPATAAPVTDPASNEDDDDATPPVDPNQAPTSPALNADGMNADKANRILDALGGVWPGHD